MSKEIIVNLLNDFSDFGKDKEIILIFDDDEVLDYSYHYNDNFIYKKYVFTTVIKALIYLYDNLYGVQKHNSNVLLVLRDGYDILTEDIAGKLGISLALYKKYESNFLNMDEDTLKKICDFFNIELDLFNNFSLE